MLGKFFAGDLSGGMHVHQGTEDLANDAVWAAHAARAVAEIPSFTARAVGHLAKINLFEKENAAIAVYGAGNGLWRFATLQGAVQLPATLIMPGFLPRRFSLPFWRGVGESGGHTIIMGQTMAGRMVCSVYDREGRLAGHVLDAHRKFEPIGDDDVWKIMARLNAAQGANQWLLTVDAAALDALLDQDARPYANICVRTEVLDNGMHVPSIVYVDRAILPGAINDDYRLVGSVIDDAEGDFNAALLQHALAAPRRPERINLGVGVPNGPLVLAWEGFLWALAHVPAERQIARQRDKTTALPTIPRAKKLKATP